MGSNVDVVSKSKSLGTLSKTNEKSSSTFFSMYVVDYISDPNMVKLNVLNNFKPLVEFKEALTKMPAGTILAIKLLNGKPEGEKIKVVLPFFSSHISQPIKAGEVVWCMQDENGQHFYLSRKHSVLKYEDVNYTANLRNRTLTPPGGKSDTVDAFNGTPPEEKNSGSFTFPPVSEKPSPALNKALTLSNTDSNAYFKGEAIAGYKTKASDFSIQGSNNTLIELGSDSTTGKLDSVGSINIVAGRGMAEKTAPDVVTNSRGFKEVDKSSTPKNMLAGTFDYINDSSRIIISMNSDIDKLFGFQTDVPEAEAANIITSLDEDLPLNTSYSMSTGAEEKVLPAIVSKSTNQLMIGRAEGTIRIVHESGSSIVMDENGNIQIQCGPEGQIRIGQKDASIEPTVLGEKLNEMILAVITEMITAAPSFVATGVGPGILAPTIVTALGNFKASLEAKENLSKIIKVE